VCLPRVPVVAGAMADARPAAVPPGGPPQFQYSPAAPDLRHPVIPTPTTSSQADGPTVPA